MQKVWPVKNETEVEQKEIQPEVAAGALPSAAISRWGLSAVAGKRIYILSRKARGFQFFNWLNWVFLGMRTQKEIVKKPEKIG